MKIDDFIEVIGGRHATIMVCQDPSTHLGVSYKVGDMVNVDRKTAFALYQQLYNLPGGGEGHRWIPKDSNITDHEAALINKHFEKTHEIEMADKPIKVKKYK